MADNLTELAVKDSFFQLLHISDGPTATQKPVLSGTGTTTALQLGTGGASIIGSFSVSGSLTVEGAFVADSFTFSDPISVADGGTAASTPAEARVNLGLGSIAVLNSPLPVANGGTGSTDAAAARTALGLGSIAVLNSPLPVADGGTGSTDAAAARTALGLGSMAIQSANNVAITGGSARLSTIQISDTAFGTVTQTTSKSSGVTINTRSGRITMDGSSLSQNTSVVFEVTNNTVTADSLVTAHIAGGIATPGTYTLEICCQGANTVFMKLRNTSNNSLSEAVQILFVVTNLNVSQ